MSSGSDWNDSVDSGGGDDLFYDGDSYDSESLKGGSNSVDKEGWYHFEITDVKLELDTLTTSGQKKSPAILFTCMVMQPVEGQSPSGSLLWHRIYLASKEGGPPAEGAVKSALRFGLGLGILKYAQKDDREIVVDAASGQSRIGKGVWLGAKGKQFVSHVKLEKGEGNYKDKYVIPFGESYHPADPKVVDVPKNTEALASIGINVATSNAVPPTAAGGGKKTTDDEFGDI